jgi:hypothetical protein
MKRRIDPRIVAAAALALVALLPTSPARADGAVWIDFETLPDGSSTTPGQSLVDAYADWGVVLHGGGFPDQPRVVFPGAFRSDIATQPPSPVAMTAARNVPDGYPAFDLIAEFTVEVHAVSADVIVNPNYGAGMTAYDASGAILGVDGVGPGSSSWVAGNLSIRSETAIARVVWKATTPAVALIGIDNLRLDLVREVEIDVRPGSSSNRVNLRSRGVLPVALLSSEDFDATLADFSTLAIGGVAPERVHESDVDGDGRTDLLLQFRIPDLEDAGVLDGETTELVLDGALLDGSAFQGEDLVHVK